MRILIDMDGVISDFEQSALDIFRNKYPNKTYIPIEERTMFRIKDEYPDDLRPLMEEITNAKGFFGNLPIVEGALEALQGLESRGYELFICTNPKAGNPYCMQEKYNWVIEHLGKEWAGKMVITEDKTIVQGDILIDDRPEITGHQKPTWEHVLYTRPYNKHVTGKRRLTWKNWESILNTI